MIVALNVLRGFSTRNELVATTFLFPAPTAVAVTV